jgi:hypothetical protein
MSINDIMAAANQTPQRPSSSSKTTPPKTPTNSVFSDSETQEAKETKDACAKGAGEIPSFKSVNNPIPAGKRVRKK